MFLAFLAGLSGSFLCIAGSIYLALWALFGFQSSGPGMIALAMIVGGAFLKFWSKQTVRIADK